MTVTIRPATSDEDMERWLSVRNAADPRPLTLAGLHADECPIRGLNESLGYVYDLPYVILRGPILVASDASPA